VRLSARVQLQLDAGVGGAQPVREGVERLLLGGRARQHGDQRGAEEDDRQPRAWLGPGKGRVQLILEGRREDLCGELHEGDDALVVHPRRSDDPHGTERAIRRTVGGGHQRDVAAGREVAIAKAWTGRAYREITLLAHQLHGGAGYVVEHELHRHSLRAKQAELLFGSTDEWLEDLADRLHLASDT